MKSLDKDQSLEDSHPQLESNRSYENILQRDENAVRGDEFSTGSGIYATLQRFAGRLGVEQRGIERVPSDERSDASAAQVATMVSGQ